QLDDTAIVVFGVNLRSHLGGHFRSLRSFPNKTGFTEVVRQRFFAVDVLLALQRRQRGKSMRMLGGADDDRIEIAIFQLIVKFAEIAELPSVRRLLGSPQEV